MSKNQTSRRDWIFKNGLGVAASAFSPKMVNFATIDGRAFEPMQAEAKTAPSGDEADRVRRMKWWHEARFGMFIHWGLYSVLGRHEWVMENEGIPVSEYALLAKQFKPSPFPPGIGPSSQRKTACAKLSWPTRNLKASAISR